MQRTADLKEYSFGSGQSTWTLRRQLFFKGGRSSSPFWLADFLFHAPLL